LPEGNRRKGIVPGGDGRRDNSNRKKEGQTGRGKGGKDKQRGKRANLSRERSIWMSATECAKKPLNLKGGE